MTKHFPTPENCFSFQFLIVCVYCFTCLNTQPTYSHHRISSVSSIVNVNEMEYFIHDRWVMLDIFITICFCKQLSVCHIGGRGVFVKNVISHVAMWNLPLHRSNKISHMNSCTCCVARVSMLPEQQNQLFFFLYFLFDIREIECSRDTLHRKKINNKTSSAHFARWENVAGARDKN